LHIADLVPDVDVLVSLEQDELGLRILQVLAVWPAHLEQIEVGTFVNGALQDMAVRHTTRVLSRKARRLAGDAKARRAFSTYRLPKDGLHPSIREDVWALYQRGKYDTAVLEAMKAVEVAVRNAAALQPTDIARR
jgi:hypothetical protein